MSTHGLMAPPLMAPTPTPTARPTPTGPGAMVEWSFHQGRPPFVEPHRLKQGWGAPRRMLAPSLYGPRSSRSKPPQSQTLRGSPLLPRRPTAVRRASTSMTSRREPWTTWRPRPSASACPPSRGALLVGMTKACTPRIPVVWISSSSSTRTCCWPPTATPWWSRSESWWPAPMRWAMGISCSPPRQRWQRRAITRVWGRRCWSQTGRTCWRPSAGAWGCGSRSATTARHHGSRPRPNHATLYAFGS